MKKSATEATREARVRDTREVLRAVASAIESWEHHAFDDEYCFERICEAIKKELRLRGRVIGDAE